jgi:GGDEF domain-containing protein
MPCSPDIEKAIAETNTAIARISAALNTSVECQGQTIHYSVSVGGAVCDASYQCLGKSVEDLYRAADADMMERKRVGKLQATRG